jgi:hypothetical protein
MMPIKGNKGQNSPKQGMKLPRRQRALVLQGGAALGAYETGVYRVLYDWISRHITEEGNNVENRVQSILHLNHF